MLFVTCIILFKCSYLVNFVLYTVNTTSRIVLLNYVIITVITIVIIYP